MCALNPRKIKKLLKNLGGLDLSSLKLEEIPNVARVEIVMNDGSRIVIENPVVSKMYIANVVLFQVQTTQSAIKQVAPSSQPSVTVDIVQIQQQQQKPKFTDEDIELVMQETGCTREEAIKALEETNGDIAEAIMLIKNRRGS